MVLEQHQKGVDHFRLQGDDYARAQQETIRHIEPEGAELVRAHRPTYILPGAEDRARRSPAHFASILHYGLRFDEVFTPAGRACGAAVVLPPNDWEITPERGAAAGFDQWPTTLGEVAAERFTSALSALEPFHHRDVPSAHWYVLLVGVSPEAQGTGLGRALLQPVLDRATAAGQPCYLETAQPKNVGFCEGLGFRVIVDLVEPVSGLRLWTFRRD